MLRRALPFLLLTTLLSATLPARAADLLVSAASSLTNAFTDIARSYEASHPGEHVQLNFGASGALLQQIARGAPADVLATADQQTMDLAQSQGLIDGAARRDVVANTLVLVTPIDSAATLSALPDLANPRVTRIAIGNPASVPVGRYAKAALEQAQLWKSVAAKTIHTQNVRQALDYVARGEVDAGFVYASDAALFRDKVKVAFTVPLAVPVRYPAAPVKASANAAQARRFTDYLLSAPAQAILARYGFGRP